MAKTSFGFLKNRAVQAATVLLVLQTLGLYAVSRREEVPLARPLASFPVQLGSWGMVQEGVVEKEVRDVLKADDLLTRTYYNPAEGRAAHLFVAYFKSQRTGQAPHSPKNCLPGSGWVPSESDFLTIKVPGVEEPIRVNRYVVAKGEEQSVVLYWYQSRDRIIASEYLARLYMIADAIRYNRTDTALVRVVVPVIADETETATKTAEQFVQSFFATLKQYLPS
ncbi:MAG TPA: EpsI family protein [Bryobacteraceae bacterium]|nr:EpsI family protein [Bryobacteraceae bacterium]HOL70671.1 EpsI family protein [Bryobacteraceae bacterium]HPQ15748.1 EpsI family protein [Bryobacteraceae bacterium]